MILYKLVKNRSYLFYYSMHILIFFCYYYLNHSAIFKDIWIDSFFEYMLQCKMKIERIQINNYELFNEFTIFFLDLNLLVVLLCRKGEPCNVYFNRIVFLGNAFALGLGQCRQHQKKRRSTHWLMVQ